jgi:carboxyl-terminal processing protease
MIAVLGLIWMLPSAAFANFTATLDLLREAEELEKQGQFDKALDLYEQLLIRDRMLPEVRERYQHCLRQIQRRQLQSFRHKDSSFSKEVLNLKHDQALNVYLEVINGLQSRYVDPERVTATLLFRQGVEELCTALTNDAFRNEYLPRMEADKVIAFRQQLRDQWGNRTVRDARDARTQVYEVALAARKALNLKPSVVVIEFACGACNSLDEYTTYLTSNQVGEELATIESDSAGIGIQVQIKDQHLLVSEVVPNSPAALAGIRENDRIIRIGQRPASKLSLDAARDLLKGETGSLVEVEVLSPGSMASRALKVARQPIIMPSIVAAHLLEPGIGFIRLINFQKSTVQELEDNILLLKAKGMKALVLDLRGNPGGLFKVAVQVAERFLPGGLIVSTRSRIRDYNQSYESHSGINALDLPLVVLVDGDTASAAEVVAGAFKERDRATLIGQTTFGKGSMQCILELKSIPSGIRITLAKFFSPLGNAYSGIGVTPHIIVERMSMGMMNDRQIDLAIQEATRLLAMRQ